MTKDTISDVVAGRLKDLRRRYGLSAAQLAEQCAAAGVPELTPAVIANIETGRRDQATGQRRRQVTVEELLALAIVLNVPPLALLVRPDAETIPVTPEVQAHPAEVLLWLLAEQPLLQASGSWSFEQMPTRLVRRWSEAILQVRNARTLLQSVDHFAEQGQEVSPEDRQAFLGRLGRALADVRIVRRELRGVGMDVQPPDDVAEEARWAGVSIGDEEGDRDGAR